MSNLFSEEFDGCGELVLELFKGTYDSYELVDGEEMTELWKRCDNGELARFQVFKVRKTGIYKAYLYSPEDNKVWSETLQTFEYMPKDVDEYWSGTDLAEAVPVWINFCERWGCKKKELN